MGGRSGKVRKLNPKTLKELQACVDVDFTVEEIEHWFREYRSSLRKGLDKLTLKEFQEVYNSVFDGDATAFTKQLFRTFDTNSDGYVDFKEFIVGLCVSGTDNMDSRFRWAFRMYDADDNGHITQDEMKEMLNAIYKMISYDHEAAEKDRLQIDHLVNEFFQKADMNDDNKINIDEFVDGVKAMPVILQLLQCDPDPEGEESEEELQTKFDNLEMKQTHDRKENSKCKSDDDRSRSYATSVKE